ncbi:MAG: ABC transporter permease [Lachnospiraceae bacterium]|nr:ABC transporter permease [Lachnospiraceae bacterium]
MNISLEYNKIKRTGFLPAFLGGGILAAVVPVVNMAFRSEIYLAQQGTPIQILLGANWQLMAMLNVLLVVSGSCLLYHTEYADNAMQKMKSLPIRESSIFFGKVILTILMSILVLTIEAGTTAFCSYHWFEIKTDFWNELCKNFGYAFLLMIPCIILSLLISEACKNMWVSLGIGVVCVFTATMLPADNFVLSLFPFATPFQMLEGTDTSQIMHYIYATVAELAFFSLAELLLIKVRRSFE